MALSLSFQPIIRDNSLDVYLNMTEETQTAHPVCWHLIVLNKFSKATTEMKGETTLMRGETELASISIPISTSHASSKVRAVVYEVEQKSDRTGIQPVIGQIEEAFSHLAQLATEAKVAKASERTIL